MLNCPLINSKKEKIMREQFLHFIWRYQYFEKQALKTVQGEEINILRQGLSNSDAGPDFGQARIRIGSMDWHGDVEIHYKSADWNVHGHGINAAYNKVILHVVWENHEQAYRKDGTQIPTLELKGRISTELISKYKNLVENLETVPCASQLANVKQIFKLAAFDQALTQRLEQKAKNVLELLHNNQLNWEETTYQLLAQNFGFKVNKEPFLALSKALPLKLIVKHADNLIHVEALLFGTAGFLNQELEDTYFQSLKREYCFLARKYQLLDKALELHQWKFLRMRPANFPTLRIAQLANFLYKNNRLFSLFRTVNTFEQLVNIFKINQSSYWKHHHYFGKPSKRVLAGFGEKSLMNLLINTVVPLLAAYGLYHDNTLFMDRAMSFLEQIPPEENKITRLWKEMGLKPRNAFDSQAQIQLYNKMCTEKRCLSCTIGTAIMKTLPALRTP